MKIFTHTSGTMMSLRILLLAALLLGTSLQHASAGESWAQIGEEGREGAPPPHTPAAETQAVPFIPCLFLQRSQGLARTLGGVGGWRWGWWGWC